MKIINDNNEVSFRKESEKIKNELNKIENSKIIKRSTIKFISLSGFSAIRIFELFTNSSIFNLRFMNNISNNAPNFKIIEF